MCCDGSLWVLGVESQGDLHKRSNNMWFGVNSVVKGDPACDPQLSSVGEKHAGHDVASNELALVLLCSIDFCLINII